MIFVAGGGGNNHMEVAIVAKNANILPSPANHTWAPGVVISNEARVLEKLDLDVRVYCAQGSKVAGRVVDFDMPSAADAFSDLDPDQRNIRAAFYNNVYQLKVIDHLRQHPVDVLHLHDYRDYPLYRAANLNIPMVVTLHGDYFANLDKMPEAVRSEINSAQIIAIGETPKLPAGIKPPFAVIDNLLDLNRFSYVAKPKDRVVYVGRLITDKGPDLAIKAAHLAHVKIGLYGEILGGQVWIDNMQELLKSSSQATYHGFLQYAKVNQAFNAKALLLPMREPEGFGNVVIEAMVSGTPVITFGLGGTKSLIKEGVNGFLIEPGNIVAMAEAIKKVGEIDRRRCREYTLKRFDELVIGQKLIDVFQRVIEGFKR